MTKSNAWICDICKEEFKETSMGYGSNIPMRIIIPSGGQYEQNVEFHFEDTCYKCREKLIDRINSLIK